MKYRLKTEEELFNQYGEGWRGRRCGFSNRQLENLGMLLDGDELGVNLSEYIDLDDEYGYFYDRYDVKYEMWMITNAVDKVNMLFSYSFLKILKSSQLDLGTKLYKLSNQERGLKDLKNIYLKENGIASYTPSGKMAEYGSSGGLLTKGRQSGRVGRVLSKICKEFDISYKDADMEQLVNFLKASMKQGEFEIVSGEDIRKYYNEDNHDKQKEIGSLKNSCMRYEKCGDYFEMYVKNPEVCRMLIFKEGLGTITGRALIWNTNEGLFMDRVYGSDSTINKFINYAKEQSWIYKKRQSHDSKKYVIVDGEEISLEMKVELKNFDLENDYFPYLDTFTYINKESVISNNKEDAEYGIMDTTDGNLVRTFKCFVRKVIYHHYECAEVLTDDGSVVEVHEQYAFTCNIDGNNYLESSMVNTRSRGLVNKLNNIDKLIFVEEDKCYEFKEDVFTCAYDGKIYCKRTGNRWSNDKVHAVIKLGKNVVEVHIKNVRLYLIKIGYKVVNDIVMSPSLSRELNIN